jgi:hypothetical protein
MNNTNFGISEVVQQSFQMSLQNTNLEETKAEWMDDTEAAAISFISAGAPIFEEDSINNDETDLEEQDTSDIGDNLFGSTDEEEEIFETTDDLAVNDDTGFASATTEPAINDDTGFAEEKTPDGINESLETPTFTDEEEEEEEEDPMCSVCYEPLTIKSIVNTKCNHTFCKKCFFRWIEVNATCPHCRDPIDSNTTLTDEQLARANAEVYLQFRYSLKDWVHNLKRNKRLLTENCKLQIENIKRKSDGEAFLGRIIRLNKDFEKTEGYNLGCIAAKNEIIYGHPMHHKNYIKNPHPRNTLWHYGYELGYHHFLEEYNELEKYNTEMDKRAFAELSEKIYTEDIEKAKENFKKITNKRVKYKIPKRK